MLHSIVNWMFWIASLLAIGALVFATWRARRATQYVQSGKLRFFFLELLRWGSFIVFFWLIPASIKAAFVAREAGMWSGIVALDASFVCLGPLTLIATALWWFGKQAEKAGVQRPEDEESGGKVALIFFCLWVGSAALILLAVALS